MSNTPTKKSVFDRIGGNSSSSSSSPSPSATTNINNKSTHGFCNAFIQTGTCPLGDTCKFIHEQPNLDKPPGLKDEFRITKTIITRVVDMSSPPIKSTVTVSNEQRPVIISNTIQSYRTVIESVTTSTDHLDRRLSSSDRKQSQSRSSTSKTKSSSNVHQSSKKKAQSSSNDNRHSSNKKQRTMESDSSVSSASDSEYVHSSQKHKKKSTHSTTSKHKKHQPISPVHRDGGDDEETLNDQLLRQAQPYSRSPKRTIVITKKRKDDNSKRSSKESKSKAIPEIEFLGSKKIKPEKKSTETIHQQAENNKKSTEVKREKKSPNRSTADQQRRHSSSTNTSSTSINERNIQIKIEDTKHQSTKIPNSSERYERSDRNAPQSTPPVVQLSPTPSLPTTSEIPDKTAVEFSTEAEKPTPTQPPSPICVILDDDSSPAPSVDRKDIRPTSTTPVKKTNETEKNTSKLSKRSRDSDKSHTKENPSGNTEIKRKRLNDGSSKKISSSSKSRDDSRSTNNRSDIRRSVPSSSRDESSSRKYKEKSDSKPARRNESKEHNVTKSRSNNARHDTARSSSEKKHSTHRHGKERENITDSEEHVDEPILPKQTALDAYMAMDWSLLSRDKRIPLNSQVTSRIARVDHSNHLVGISERLLTQEQKEKLNGLEFQSLPLTHFMKQLQKKPTSQMIHSCNRRFGSCAKDMIDMRHKWFTRSIEPVQQYEFINKDHYVAFQQAMNSLLNKTSTDASTVQIETTTADVLLS